MRLYLKRTHLRVKRKKSDLVVEPNAALAWELDYKGCENGN